MRTPRVLPKSIDTARLNFIGAGLFGATLIDALPGIAGNPRDEWSKEKDVKEHRAELETLAQATREQLAEEVEKIIRDVAAGASPDVREAIRGYLMSRCSFPEEPLRMSHGCPIDSSFSR